MELADFAQTILCEPALNKKLESPSSFSDQKPGPLTRLPDLPARDEALRFYREAGHARLSFPSDNALHTKTARALVFHAFANHELLAMELMALAILKFPTAPASFRLGLARCITEEQSHLRLYLQRMQDLGIDFGDHPVNGFFWNVLKNMKSPLDFVTGMSLTFEQANLDFSSHYQKVFHALGDELSANIMERVYREEVGHVKFGVQWLEKWRPPTDDQWKFYCANLPLPLTPQRAKGIHFDSRHRENTGLTPEFVNQLESYSHSRGRPPEVFVFNSSCELEWSAFLKNQSTFQAPKFQDEIASDLASLMMFLGHQEDVVALPVPPSAGMIRQWREWGFGIPHFLPYEKSKPEALSAELKAFKIKSFEPWGWSPVIAQDLQPFRSAVLNRKTDWPPSNDDEWRKLAACFQKTSACELLRTFLSANSRWKSELCPSHVVGKVCFDWQSTLCAIEALKAEKPQPVVLKAPLGSSGYAMIRILTDSPDPQQKAWVEKILRTQGAIVIEPWLERIADFSAQLEVDRNTDDPSKRVRYLGFTRMLADKRGQYAGHQLGKKFEDIPADIRRRVLQTVDGIPSLYQLLQNSAEHVGQWLWEQGFQGPAGVDAFLYRCPETGQPRLKPIVEVNARYTMGRIALELEKYLATGVSAKWVHMSKPRLAKLGFFDWVSWLDDLRARHPMEVVPAAEPTSKPRLRSGVFPTNDPAQAKSFLSVLLVTP